MLISFLLVVVLPWMDMQAFALGCDAPYSQSHFKIEGHVSKKMSMIPTRKQCEKQCSLQHDCRSINFYKRNGICELNSADHLSNPESLMPSDDCQYVGFSKRLQTKCSNRFCSEPLLCKVINNDVQDYECVHPCEESSGKVEFPRKSITDYLIYENPLTTSLSAFTVAAWVHPDKSKNAPLCYSSVTHSEHIYLFLAKSNTQIGIDSFTNIKTPTILDGKWHHLCLTWENAGGNYKFYIDGVVQQQGSSVRIGHLIPTQGAFIVGQEPDGYKSNFEASQSFKGNLTSVNMWDRVLTTQEVLALYRSCPTVEGNVIAWSTLKTKGVGSVKLI